MLTLIYSASYYMGDSNCHHIELTDEGTCKACGVNITTQEFIDSLPEPPPDSQLGDIPGIIRLAQATAEIFLNRQALERDPNRPSQPKIKWVGSLMIRPPRETIWTEIVKSSFDRAKAIGYKGNLERWDDVCMEYVLFLKDAKNSQKL